MKASYNRMNELLRRQFQKSLIGMKKKIGAISHREIARICGTSPASVDRWFQGTKLPNLTSLFLLADFFGCPAYNLIFPEEMMSYYLTRQPKLPATYADDFAFFLRLCDSKYLKFQSSDQLVEMIVNPITRFLVDTFFKHLSLVKSGEVADSELHAWVKKMTKDFDIPVSPASPEQVDQVFSSHRSFDMYGDYLRTARYLRDHAKEMQIEEAEGREEIFDTYSWLDPNRVPDPEEFAQFPDFYGDPYEWGL